MNPRKLDEFHEWTLNHWIINTILISFPSIWFTIIQVAGKQMHLLNEQGQMKGWVSFLFWLFIIVSIIYNGVLSWKDAKQYSRQQHGQEFYKNIITGFKSACFKKKNDNVKYIFQSTKRNFSDPFSELIDPNNQIEKLIDELSILLAQLFNMSKDEIGISIICKFDGDRKWNWLHRLHLNDGTDTKELIDGDSTLRSIIDEKSNFIFLRDKREGIPDGFYLTSIRDKQYETRGSIICRDIGVKYEKQNYVLAILSITTYGKEICSEQQEDEVKERLEMILSNFDVRFQIELSLMYVKYYHNQKKEEKEIG